MITDERLLQLQAALESERELFRQDLIDEAGSPRMLTYVAQLDPVLEDASELEDAERAVAAKRHRGLRAVPADEVVRSPAMS